MKKIFSVLIIILLVFSLFACEDVDTDVAIKNKNNNDITIWTDPETGVQYIVYCEFYGYSGAGGITPRLNADGTLYITTEKGGE